MDLPWQAVGIGQALSLAFSALGFKRVVYLVSIGYAGSIVAQAIAIPLLYRETSSPTRTVESLRSRYSLALLWESKMSGRNLIAMFFANDDRYADEDQSKSGAVAIRHS